MGTFVSAIRVALVSALFGLAATAASAQDAVDLHNLTEFNANVQPSFSNLRFNSRTGTTTYSVRLTNLSDVDVPAPIYLAIMNVTALSATVANATGKDVNGIPFFVVGQTLRPGESTAFDVIFGNTGRNRFTFTPHAFGVVADLFVTLDDPPNLALTNLSLVNVAGRVTPGAAVTVNGLAAVVLGDRYTVANVPLPHEGGNALSATARDVMDHVANVASTIVRDTTPPTIVIGHPRDGSVVFTDTISVQAAVNDPIAGLMGGDPPTATVNGAPALFQNDSVLAPSVQLAPGDNEITVEVTDAAGNTTSATTHVTYDAAAVRKIRVSAGDDQSAPISQALAHPLVAQLLDEAGSPVPDVDVFFRVTQSNGVFPDSTRLAAARTDSNGLASMGFLVGSRTGQGCNRVEASAPGYRGAAAFVSTSLGGVPQKIGATQGEMQRAAVSSQAPMALVALVTDVGNNMLPGVRVIFRVVAGGGHFDENEGTALAVTTDMMGRVSAVFVLGPVPGVENNVVEAMIEETPEASPVRFVLTGLEPGDPADTTFSGIVLDHTDAPLPHVKIHLGPGNHETFTDAAGQFRLTGVPVGPIHLTADATTTTTPGTWGSISYERVTVPGVDNSLGMPIHLLPMYTNHPIAGGAQDVTLTLPEIPGFHLKIFANSATFPNGDHTGLVTVTAVRTDKIPMPPADGMAPNFIITVQPPDVLFDPPAEFAIPNVEGYLPGQMTNMFSFDHALGRFVSIGPGTCSEDGSVVTSNPGFGIVKAGWHCAAPPLFQGQAEPVKVTINGQESPVPICLHKDEEITLTAAGTPQPPRNPARPYNWVVPSELQLVAGTLNSATIRLRSKNGGPAGAVVVEYECVSGEADTARIVVGKRQKIYFEDQPSINIDGARIVNLATGNRFSVTFTLYAVSQDAAGSGRYKILDSMSHGYTVDARTDPFTATADIYSRGRDIKVTQFNPYANGESVGLQIRAEYTGCAEYSLQWVQVVETSNVFHPCYPIFLDPCPNDDDLPFYNYSQPGPPPTEHSVPLRVEDLPD